MFQDSAGVKAAGHQVTTKYIVNFFRISQAFKHYYAIAKTLIQAIEFFPLLLFLSNVY